VTAHAAVSPSRSTRSIGWVPFALVAVVVVPAIAGSLCSSFQPFLEALNGYEVIGLTSTPVSEGGG
jgi:hypothetical protein